MTTRDQSFEATESAAQPGHSRPQTARPGTGPIKVLATLVQICLPLAFLAGAGYLGWILLKTAPEQERTVVEPLIPVVEVMEISPSTLPVSITGFGEVIPAHQVQISPEVRGNIIEIHPLLQPGGIIEPGEVLFRIDPKEYEIAVLQAEAELAQAQADLDLERGRGMVAQEEWQRFSQSIGQIDIDSGSASLANREPQMRQVEARVQMAKAALELAKLNLDRTTVLAPFRATVIEENVEIGRRTGPEDNLITLAGTDAFWVTISVLPSKGQRLSINSNAKTEALITIDHGMNVITERRGEVLRILPEVDSTGRMMRLLVAVDDPLAIDSDGRPLRIGDYARAEIMAGELEGVVSVPREAIRENEQVWLLTADNTLRVAPATIRWRNERTFLIEYSFEESDRLITSFLNDPVPGQALRANAGGS